MSEAALRERVEQLEAVIGVDRSAMGKLRDAFPSLEPAQAEILAMLLRRDFVDRDGLFTVRYGALPDADMPDEKVLDAHVCRLRRFLDGIGVTFETAKDSGWWMPKPMKTRLRQIIDGLPAPDLDVIARREEQKRKRQAFLWGD